MILTVLLVMLIGTLWNKHKGKAKNIFKERAYNSY